MWGIPFLVLSRAQRKALDARRRDRTWRYFAWSAIAGAVASLLVATVLFVTFVLIGAGLWWLAAIFVVLFGIPVAQEPLLRYVIVPRGWVRTAFWIGHLGAAGDGDAPGLVFAAWAYLRRPTPAGESWIAMRRDRRHPLGDAEVVTTALLLAARGDADGARRLVRSTLDLVENHPAVRELAGEWLACDAAARGAWDELAADAAAARFPASPLTYFLEGVARAHVAAARGEPVRARRADLALRWLFAPHHRTTWALLASPVAGSAPPVAACDEPALAPDAASAPMSRAVAAHVSLGDRASADQLAAAVAAWDAALADPAMREWLARRALELDAPVGAAARAAHGLTRAVTDELAHLAEARTLGAPPSRGPVGDALARRLRHGRLDALEAAFSRWADRRSSGDVRRGIDEWRELVALRAAYDDAAAAGGLELRRLAFPHAYKTGNAMAVWLWNTRNEYALSHAISAWLAAEAHVVGDAEAIELCARNLRLAVPTRTGKVTVG